jgi:hypothetical protein
VVTERNEKQAFEKCRVGINKSRTSPPLRDRMGAAANSKLIPLVEPFRCFAHFQIAEFDRFAEAFSDTNSALGITETELGSLLTAYDSSQPPETAQRILTNRPELTKQLFAALREDPEAVECETPEDCKVINALSLLAGLCIISCMNERTEVVDILSELFDMFNLSRNSGLSLSETTIMVLSTCRALEVMSGYVNDKGVGHVTIHKAESIAKSAYMKYGKSNGQSLLSSGEFVAFIMSKLIQHDITVAQLDDEAFGEDKSSWHAFDIIESLPTAYDSWSEAH